VGVDDHAITVGYRKVFSQVGDHDLPDHPTYSENLKDYTLVVGIR